MDGGQQWLAMLSILTLSIGVFAPYAQGAVRQCATEECACEEALRQNTVEALEEFLRKYPQGPSSQESACAALAVPLSNETVDPVSQDSDDGGLLFQPDFSDSEE